MQNDIKNNVEVEILTTIEVAKLIREDKRTIEIKAKNGFYPPSVCNRQGRLYKFHKQNLLKFLFPDDKES
jgi:hypothetical protein